MTMPSLADIAIDALSKVSAIGENMDNDHPMRHVVRGMKHVAEQMLSDAMRQATTIYYQATQLENDFDAAMEEIDADKSAAA